MDNQAHEAMKLLHEALDLANKAVEFDKSENHYEAVGCYDKTVVSLDEILCLVPVGTTQWSKCIQLREEYADRMQILRQTYASHHGIRLPLNIFNNNANADAGNDKQQNINISSLSSSDNNNNNNNNFEPITLKELENYEKTFEKPPQSMLLIPYWLLRSIQRSIQQGSYITKRLLLSKEIWEQDGAKLSGVSVKTAVFKSMIDCLDQHLSPIREPCSTKRISPSPSISNDNIYNNNRDDEKDNVYVFPKKVADYSLEVVHEACIVLTTIRSELGQCQNQLARSFSYVPELQPDERTSVRSADADVPQHLRRNSDLAPDSNTNSTSINSDNSDNSIASIDNNNSNNNSNNNNNRNSAITDINMDQDQDQDKERRSNSIGGSMLGFFSSAARGLERASVIVSKSASLLTKKVSKAADQSVARINVMHTRISKFDLQLYCNNIIYLSEKCQRLHEWYEYYESLRTALLEVNITPNGSPQRGTTTDGDDDGDATMHGHLVSMIESVLAALLQITRIVKDSIVEVTLRDAEELHRIYCNAMQTNLLRLEWEGEE
jgi:hypothetical protein